MTAHTTFSDLIEKIDLMNSTLHEIREANEAGADPPYAATLVIYNFPDRDCSAEASAGELHIDEDGVERYKTEYIDPIAELVQEFSDVRHIFVYGVYFQTPLLLRLSSLDSNAHFRA